jgi:putative nucleotidyltransferase with HDIG domain
VIGRYMGGKLIATHGFFRDISERKQAEENVLMLQSLQNAISKINQLLVRVKDESELFQIVCNILIKVEYIKFAWIGLTNKEDFTIKPVAQAGFEEGYLSSIKVTWDDSKYGNGPTGIALKTFQPFIMRNIKHDPKFKPWRNEALKRGYLSSIALPLIYKKELMGALNVYSGGKETFGEDEVRFLKEVAEDIAIGIRSLRSELQLKQSYQKLEMAMDATIEAMSKIIEAKDPYTAGHQQRVSKLATAIAKELSLPEDKIEGIRIASLIHDIGKIGIPTEILSKPTRLADIEFSLIKEHSQIGYDILKSIDFSYPVANIILQHHERLNGSGYPNNLRGDEILLEARIIGVADVVEAMSSHRPYRPALGIEKALEEISQNKGILYDLKVVEACLKLFKEKGFKFE